MAVNGLEIFDHTEAGYARKAEYDAWVVALCNPAERFTEAGRTYIERHMETDEVFVLLEGSAYLTIGLEMTRVDLEPNKIYNVKKGVWHSHIMSPDAKVLIVENSNTSAANSEKLPLSELGK